jgi:hypothetical protein
MSSRGEIIRLVPIDVIHLDVPHEPHQIEIGPQIVPVRKRHRFRDEHDGYFAVGGPLTEKSLPQITFHKRDL